MAEELTFWDRIRRGIYRRVGALYYLLTGWVPRMLPRDAEEWYQLQDTLVLYFGLADKPQVWATVAGHVSSTPGYRRRRSYRYLANVALRLQVNAEAKKVTQVAVAELKRDLAEAMKREAGNNAIKDAVAETMAEAANSQPF